MGLMLKALKRLERRSAVIDDSSNVARPHFTLDSFLSSAAVVEPPFDGINTEWQVADRAKVESKTKPSGAGVTQPKVPLSVATKLAAASENKKYYYLHPAEHLRQRPSKFAPVEGAPPESTTSDTAQSETSTAVDLSDAVESLDPLAVQAAAATWPMADSPVYELTTAMDSLMPDEASFLQQPFSWQLPSAGAVSDEEDLADTVLDQETLVVEIAAEADAPTAEEFVADSIPSESPNCQEGELSDIGLEMFLEQGNDQFLLADIVNDAWDGELAAVEQVPDWSSELLPPAQLTDAAAIDQAPIADREPETLDLLDAAAQPRLLDHAGLVERLRSLLLPRSSNALVFAWPKGISGDIANSSNSNLLISLAEQFVRATAESLLIVDATLRQECVQLIGLSPAAGICEVLQGAPIESAVMATSTPGIGLIGRGSSVSTQFDPAMANESYQALSEAIPMMLIAVDADDVQIAPYLMKHADATLLLVELGRTSAAAAQKARQSLLSHCANLVGCIALR